MQVVDSHQHFWRYDPAEYGWIDRESMQCLARDYLPADLIPAAKQSGVDAVVAVQARQTVDETRWLLEIAERTPEVAGVVGWAPLCSPDVRDHLAALTHPLLKGVRHVVHDEPDDRFLLREQFNRGVAALVEFGLTYDILIFERHLPATIEFVDRHPHQPFVVDHIAKPKIAEGSWGQWAAGVRELARRENIVCKVSGMATEADWSGWSAEALKPYFDLVLECFGPKRLMFGSDWPVCLLATRYAQWKSTVDAWAGALSQGERDQLFGQTAIDFYQLHPQREAQP